MIFSVHNFLILKGKAITLSIKRSSASHHTCSFPSCADDQTLRAVPFNIRQKILQNLRFYLPQGVRACERHIQFDSWECVESTEGALYEYDAKKIEDMVDMLRTKPPTTSEMGNIICC